MFEVNKLLLWADFDAKQSFEELKNTLHDTIAKMPNGTSRRIVVEFIQGRPEECLAKIMADIHNDDDVLEIFDKNTFIVPKS